MSVPPNLVAVIVAAGSSQRMGFDKLTASLLGRPLIVHTLAAFQNCPDVDRVALVCAADRVGEFRTLAAEFPKVDRVVPGGNERFESVRFGLESFASAAPEFVAVHDGARPLVVPETISRCYREARTHGAAVCAEPETDTLHRVDAVGCAVEHVPRENLWRMQTPQIAGFSRLLSLLRDLPEGGATDEISVILRSGGRARVVDTGEWNFKVTNPRDLPLAEHVLRTRLS